MRAFFKIDTAWLFNHKIIEEGCQRLERLAKLALKPDEVARLIQSTVWPMALLGTDAVYVGKEHFSRLRSLAAAALTKKTAATSIFLSLSTLSHVLLTRLFLQSYEHYAFGGVFLH